MAATSLHSETVPATVNVPVADIERMVTAARLLETLLIRADVVLATILAGDMLTSNPNDKFERDAINNASSLLSFLQDDLATREKLEGTDLSIQLACLVRF
jgi:hypothetical protein